MAGMYPDNQTLELFGEPVSWPGVNKEGKFTNGSFSDPLERPSFIPAETVNLILDNLSELIASLGKKPNNKDTDQLVSTIAAALALKANIQTIKSTTLPTVGWYRIAASAKDIGRNIGHFKLHGTVSGAHSTAIVIAGSNYGSTANNTLTQLGSSHFSKYSLTKVRLVYHTTYANNYAYLEVYNNAANNKIEVELIQNTGWTLQTPSDGSIPSGYSNQELTFSPGIVSNEYKKADGTDILITTLTDAAEANTLPATASASIPTLLQTVRNCLKWLVSQVALKAGLAGSTFTGAIKIPSKTTAATSDGTLVASEAQVKAVADAAALKAPLASPALTGTPTAPTAAVKNNSTQIATTAYADRAGHPVGSYYTQYPVAEQATVANMFPATESPATLFGGTWAEQFGSEDVFFRTGALGAQRGNQWNDTTKNYVAGTIGIEPDAERNKTGRFRTAQINASFPLTGVFASIDDTGGGVGGSGYGHYAEMSVNRVNPTDITNHPKNRLIKVWKRTA